ncbi:malate dehydrogenase (NAD-dependent) [anaerobic digester metagenome]|jgi:malate dehydrogenase|uniref:Malate dehydrogenase (NAD-dependent) n=1 Tax=anaerobic digester metagenome TaxID=1263854 RepID=A0A485LX96_9ZZZZ
MIKRKKITIVGAGNVGATAAHWAASRELGDVVLVDVIEGVPQGKALDLMQAAPVMKYDSNIIGTNNYEDTADSDVAIITAGVARKPGMSRDDLLNINYKIVGSVAENIARYSPNCTIIVVSNPLDVMTYTAYKASGFPANRVFGQAGVLDSARFRTFVAMELGVSFEDVNALVLGGHGDTMVSVLSHANVGCIPVTKLIPPERLAEIVKRTANGGAEIVNFLKTGSAFYAPSASAVTMAEAVLKDKKRILPVAAYLNGEYGAKDIYTGVPCIIGGNGVEKIIEIDLTPDEKAALDKSIQAVRDLMKVVGLGS